MTNSHLASLSAARRLDALSDRFEAAWKSGEAPRIEAFLESLPATERAAALADLLGVELELRRHEGSPPQRAEYRTRFPDLPGVVDAAFGLAATLDTSVRSVAGTLPTGIKPRASDPTQVLKIGRFEVIGLLGEGTFGKVYRCRDPQVDREVAIKVPRPGSLTSRADVDRFLREARAVGQLRHENICRVYEVGEDDGQPFIVMDLVPGQTLAQHLARLKRPMDVQLAVGIVRSLARTLAVAHAKGIIHRDLKPANLLHDRERKSVVIMDFGLARSPRRDQHDKTLPGTVMGTPAYMSPEQASGDQDAVGPASDIYSLGVILFELLTGRRPFTSKNVGELLAMVTRDDPPPPSSLRPGLDPRLEAICLKAMAKRPQDRYASMHALDEALDQWSAVARLPPPATPDELSYRLAVANQPSPTEASTSDAWSIDLQPDRPTSAVQAWLGRRRRRFWEQAIAVGLLAAAVLCGIVIYISTNEGTVKIVLSDPAAQVEVKVDGKRIELSGLGESLTFRTGPHGLVVTGKNYETVSKSFTLKRGEHRVLNVELLAASTDNGGKSAALTRIEPAPRREQSPPATGQAPSEPVQPAKLQSEAQKAAIAEVKNAGMEAHAFLHHLITVDPTDPRNTDSKEKRFPGHDAPIVARGAFPKNNPDFQGPFNEALVAAESLANAKDDELKGKLDEFNARMDTLSAKLKEFDSSNVVGKRIADIIQGQLATEQGRVAAAAKILAAAAGPPVTTADASRAIAQWVYQLGGKVGTDEQEYPTFDELPPGRLRIKIVSLGFTQATDADLARLAPLTELTKLHLHGCKIGDEAMAHLAAHKRLTWLSLWDTDVGDEGMKHVAGLADLECLVLNGTRVTDAGLAQLSKLTRLKELSLEELSGVTGNGLRNLRGLSRLEQLHLKHTSIDDDGLVNLAGLTTLRMLVLSDTRIGDAGLMHLAGLTKLDYLGLNATQVTDAGLAQLRGLGDLRELGLAAVTGIHGDGLKHLDELARLEYLDLHDTSIDDKAMSHLSGLSSLRTLILSDTNVGNNGLAAIKPLTNLRLLNLTATQVTDSGVRQCEELVNLRELSLDYTSVSPAAVESLQKALPTCKITAVKP